MISHNQLIDTLNNLIETCKDGDNGFRAAARGVTNPDLKTLLRSYQRQRAHFARELQDEVRRLGGDPQRRGSLSATLHRGWMKIKVAVTGRDETAIVTECERGEDAARQNYEEALREQLPPEVQAILERQFAAVKEAHDRIRALEVATSKLPS
jgi:uncharacterized protein (TIGR02284 family)